MFLPSSIILEAMKKKLATSSFPKYFYANSPDVDYVAWIYVNGRGAKLEEPIMQCGTYVF